MVYIVYIVYTYGIHLISLVHSSHVSCLCVCYIYSAFKPHTFNCRQQYSLITLINYFYYQMTELSMLRSGSYVYTSVVPVCLQRIVLNQNMSCFKPQNHVLDLFIAVKEGKFRTSSSEMIKRVIKLSVLLCRTYLQKNVME